MKKSKLIKRINDNLQSTFEQVDIVSQALYLAGHDRASAALSRAIHGALAQARRDIEDVRPKQGFREV